MPCTEFNTWNRALHFGVSHGGLTGRILRGRTLEIQYVDRAVQFDHIEWKLDNEDGLLTDPKYLALGLVVFVKFGYLDGMFPWKAFVINRLKGGVGVAGVHRPAVNENEAVITYHGRNRNARGGRPSRSWKKTATAPPRKKGKIYPPTIDVTSREMLLPAFDTPYIPGRKTSEVVEYIARRNGYVGANAIIQDSEDTINGYAVQAGMSDLQVIKQLAREFKFICKVDGDVLKWHSPDYVGADSTIVERLTYGGPDILSLDIDADFKLPLPTNVRAEGYDPRRNVSLSELVTKDDFAKNQEVGTLFNDIGKDPARRGLLMRNEVSPLIGGLSSAGLKARQRFLQRHWNAFQLNIKVVGNPKLLATRKVQIAGTGSKLVDGIWYISEARHTIDHTTYVTEIKLKHPPKRSQNRRSVSVSERVPKDKRLGTQEAATLYHDGAAAYLRRARKQRRQPLNISRR
jgi:phage protein D